LMKGWSPGGRSPESYYEVWLAESQSEGAFYSYPCLAPGAATAVT
jgi:hypothetical protein